MREPALDALVRRDLRLLRTIDLHPPDLHRPGPLGVEVDVLPIRRVLRTVVFSSRGGQSLLRAAVNGDGVDVEVAVALRAVRDGPAVRRPPVKIRRRAV